MLEQTTPTGFGAMVVTPEQLYQNFLKERQFDDHDIQCLGLELLAPDQTKELIGHTYDWSIKIPYRDVDGQVTGFDRVRILTPKGKMKYSQARASGSHVFFPPDTNWKKVLTDIDIPIIITEGEFKAWAITKSLVKDNLPYACIGLAGVTSWTDKHGLHLHKDLMQIMWKKKTSFEQKHRKVYVIFDYDGAKSEGEPNEQVALAETKMAITLRGMGAEVHLCRVGKFGYGEGKKYAIDDHLLKGGTLGEVLTTTSVVMNGLDTLDVKLHEFSTKYALFNGDIIRLNDGHIMSFQKAKIDSAQHIFIQTSTAPGRNGGPPKVTSREIPMLEEYKKWHKRCDIKKVGVFPQYQGLRITPDGCYNYLNAWAYEPTRGSIDLYTGFCEYFFRDEPEFVVYWHNWIANIIQHPHRRNNTTPQFVSNIEGIGKSAVAEFIAEMMGLGEGGPATIVGPDELFGSFNGILKNKIFVVVNEPSSDREDHSAKLKNFITSKEITINNKYGHQYSIENYMNFVFTTNRPYVTTMGNNARREAIYKPETLTNAETRPLVNELMKWARGGGFGHVLNWYYERDISQFDPYEAAPETKRKAQIVKLSQSPTQQFANDLVQWSKDHVGEVAFFTNQQLQIMYKTWQGDEKMPASKYIKAALANLTPGEEVVISLKQDLNDKSKTMTVRGWMIGLQNVISTCNRRAVAQETAAAIAREVQSSSESF